MTNEMKVLYARERLPKTIFLAGPTPRDDDVKSWRPQAIEDLKFLGFTGTVLVPEDRDALRTFDYDDQVNWEWEGLSTATVIVFWVPRELKKMPAMITNVEFGMYIASGKVVFGAPLEAQKMGYLKALADRYHVNVHTSLLATLKAAVKFSENLYL
jgi:hypothetical protein